MQGSLPFTDYFIRKRIMRSEVEFAVDAFLTSVRIGWDALDAGFYSHRLLEKQSHRVSNYGTDMLHHLPHSPLSFYLSRPHLFKRSQLCQDFFKCAINLETFTKISEKWSSAFIYSSEVKLMFCCIFSSHFIVTLAAVLLYYK